MNTSYAKLSGSTIEYAPSVLKVNGRIISNPSAATYLANGWYPVQTTIPAASPGTGKMWQASGYSLVDGIIVTTYTAVDKEDQGGVTIRSDASPSEVREAVKRLVINNGGTVV